MGCEVAVRGASAAGLNAIRAVFERYDATFSRFRSDSELVRVNAMLGARLVSPFFARVLERALWAARVTDGLVDPTVGAAIAAAGYDRDFAGLPGDGPATAGSSPPGAASVRLCGLLVTLTRGTQLDLNGVVKALAVDEAAALLDGPGVVAAGGDLRVCGPVDVALEGGPVRVVVGGLATSGTTSRTWLRGGERQHHLIDPSTGEPSRSPWRQVTVAARTCLDADVAAKAAFLHGETGPAWLDAAGLAGRFVAPDCVVETARWSRETAACI